MRVAGSRNVGRRKEERRIPQQKESRRNCCNSPAARRVPKNADSICKQSNREASGTQDFCSLNFEKNTEVLYADSR